jgi:serine/threonine protein kinase
MVFREAELLKSLDHRNIVKIYSCYTLQNMQVIFIMEYLEGGELLEYVECNPGFDYKSVGIFLRRKREYSSSK